MNLFSERKFISAKTGKGLKYLYYSPNTDGNLPLIIYLHGAGSRGTELSQLSHAGPIGELEKGRNIPARMVAPQCCGDTWFELFETLIDFAENMANESGVDKAEYILPGKYGGICRVAARNDKARYVRGACSCLRRRNVLECRTA